MPALYTITTRASGTILTAAIYNTDHQNHVNNGDAQHLGGFSANTSQMRTQTSPGDTGSESLALSISDELARIRYMIALIRGTTFWYGTQASYPGGGAAGGTGNFLRNSNFLNFSRQGQAGKAYAASAGSPYTADQWYVSNNPNQAFGASPSFPLYSNDTSSLLIQRNAGQTGTGAMWVGQPFTLTQLTPMIGKQVCASVSFSTGSNWSAPNILLSLTTGTGTACKFSAGFTSVTTVLSVTQPTTPNTALTRISATGVVPVGTTQMDLLLYWTPAGTAGANETIFFAQPKLELGSQPTLYIPPDPYVELIELSSFYWKSFGLGILPQTNAGTSGSFSMQQASGAAAGNNGNGIRWPTRMIKPPTVVTYNPAAANAQPRNLTRGGDCSALVSTLVDESGCVIQYTSAAGSVVGDLNAVHLTADAGL